MRPKDVRLVGALPLRSTSAPPPLVRSWLRVAVLLRQPKAARRRGFGIELDQHRRLIADDPGVMPGLHDQHLRRDELEAAPVGILATDVASS
jgi:hypothetical protein